VEAAPPTLAALHRQNPVNCPLRHLVLIAFAGVVHFAEREQNLPGIISIRVKLIVELEVPSTWVDLWHLDRPVAFVADFLGENPVSCFDQPWIIARDPCL